jgi:electron transfer flavoprotein alpha subunit
MNTLILAELVNQQISLATRCVITAAQKLDRPIHLLLFGNPAEKLRAEACCLSGVSHVIINTAKAYAEGRAEPICALLASMARDYNTIFAASSCYSHNILPRLAAMLDVAHIANITEIISANTFVRPIYAGNVLATVKTSDPIIVGTIRHTAFSHCELSDKEVTVTTMDDQFDDNRSEILAEALTNNDRPTLTDARIIVAGGRGFKSQHDLETLLFPLADKLHAAIGATRAIVDAGFIANDYQVGQTGKVVAPELYIAIGISGQIQHIAGMKESKMIVAINQDPETPIMKIADYALVADLYQAIPEFLRYLSIFRE